MQQRLRRVRDWFLSRLTVGRVGLVLLVVALPGLVLSDRLAHSGPFRLSRLLSEFYAGFASELVSIAFTVLIIDRIYQQQAARQEREQLVRQLRSSDVNLVLEAVEQLRTRGWLADGTLCGKVLNGAVLQQMNLQSADFRGALLVEADLTEANLERACLAGVDLQGGCLRKANLRGADLQQAVLSGADLSGVDLRGADVSFAQLAQADRLVDAILPDGSRYDGRFQLPGDLLLARTAHFNPNDPVAMARFYEVPLDTYLQAIGMNAT
ncbi:MAG: pentapeptide repeat-containing protein [Chloroflexi bacterium]|nr:MAG: pentapeptide repeat-containing protein [Chloroflexota bacterium]